VGTPDVTRPEMWPSFYPAIDAALKHGGILGVHEYDWPNINSTNGWLTLRYRKVYDQFLKPAGKVIPLAITECGLDSGGSQGSGWRSGKLSAAQYAGQLEWYDKELKKDSFVQTATIYQIGIYGWQSFSLSGECVKYLTEYVKKS